MQPTSPPQELEFRSPDNERFTSAVKNKESTEKPGQFLLPLPRAARGWDANHALSGMPLYAFRYRVDAGGCWRMLADKGAIPVT